MHLHFVKISRKSRKIRSGGQFRRPQQTAVHEAAGRFCMTAVNRAVRYLSMPYGVVDMVESDSKDQPTYRKCERRSGAGSALKEDCQTGFFFEP
jgi:hypothetical protein